MVRSVAVRGRSGAGSAAGGLTRSPARPHLGLLLALAVTLAASPAAGQDGECSRWDVSGTWHISMDPPPPGGAVDLVLRQTGEDVTGVFTRPWNGGTLSGSITGRIVGDRLELRGITSGAWQGTVGVGGIGGTYAGPFGQVVWEGRGSDPCVTIPADPHLASAHPMAAAAAPPAPAQTTEGEACILNVAQVEELKTKRASLAQDIERDKKILEEDFRGSIGQTQTRIRDLERLHDLLATQDLAAARSLAQALFARGREVAPPVAVRTGRGIRLQDELRATDPEGLGFVASQEEGRVLQALDAAAVMQEISARRSDLEEMPKKIAELEAQIQVAERKLLEMDTDLFLCDSEP